MLKNMAISLIEHKRIKTTVAKAKELRKFVEPIITKTKEDNTSNRRLVFALLSNKNAVKELFGNVRPAIINREGGYTRILRIGNRAGDNAEMCIIELVDFNELAPGKASSSAAKKKSRRRGGAGTKKVEGVVETPVAEEVTAVVEETPAVVEETVAEVSETTEQLVEETQESVAEETSTEETKEEGSEDAKA